MLKLEMSPKDATPGARSEHGVVQVLSWPVVPLKDFASASVRRAKCRCPSCVAIVESPTIKKVSWLARASAILRTMSR